MRRQLIAALGLVASSTLAFAQDWPTRPVTMIRALRGGRPGRHSRPHHGARADRSAWPAGVIVENVVARAA